MRPASNRITSCTFTSRVTGKKYPLTSNGCFDIVAKTDNTYEAAVLLAICQFNGKPYQLAQRFMCDSVHMDGPRLCQCLQSLIKKGLILSKKVQCARGFMYMYKPAFDVSDRRKYFIPRWIFSTKIEWPMVDRAFNAVTVINGKTYRQYHKMNALRLVALLLVIDYKGYGSQKRLIETMRSCKLSGEPMSKQTMYALMRDYISHLVERFGEFGSGKAILKHELASKTFDAAYLQMRRAVAEGKSIKNTMRGIDHQSNSMVADATFERINNFDDDQEDYDEQDADDSW